MRYILDLLLVVGLVWAGYLWTGEKMNGLALGDQIEKLKANLSLRDQDLDQAKAAGAQMADELASVKGALDQTAKELQDQTAALATKTAEAEELRTAATALKARVDELQGYKNQAQQAVTVEAPAPAAAAP